MTLTLRLTPEDRALLDRLVVLRTADLPDEVGEVTATSYIRGLIRREARAKGLVADDKTTPGVIASEVHFALARALNAGESQRSIAKRAGINASQVSRFAEGGGLAPDSLAKLATALKST